MPDAPAKPLQLQVATKAVIENEDGAVLLLQRSKPYHGQTVLTWDIPGGRIDSGESLEQALRRELKEETDLELESVGPVLHVKDFIIETESIHVVRITFKATVKGEIKLSHEHTDYRWVPKAELPLEPTAIHFIEALQANGWIRDYNKQHQAL